MIDTNTKFKHHKYKDKKRKLKTSYKHPKTKIQNDIKTSIGNTDKTNQNSTTKIQNIPKIPLCVRVCMWIIGPTHLVDSIDCQPKRYYWT